MKKIIVYFSLVLAVVTTSRGMQEPEKPRRYYGTEAMLPSDDESQDESSFYVEHEYNASNYWHQATSCLRSWFPCCWKSSEPFEDDESNDDEEKELERHMAERRARQVIAPKRHALNNNTVLALLGKVIKVQFVSYDTRTKTIVHLVESADESDHSSKALPKKSTEKLH